ncbi:MAG: alpha/beta fold hydrolase [Anaerolineae bacterium]|nr:alpha/beta fold hydrolase [Anaerolineae bacterium]
MKNLIRLSVTSLLIMLFVVPVLAQDTITLNPYTDKTFGFTGVVPDGWKDVGNGLYRRQKSATDITLFAQQSVPLAADKVMTAMLPQLGLTTAPDSVGTYKSAALDWTLYKVDVKAPAATISVDFALAEDKTTGRTYIVFLQTTSDEYDALHKTVFQPALDALAPYVEPESTDTPYTQEDVTLKNGDVTLAGTLTLPEGDGPFPAIVLVTGSGAQDRDETIGAMKPFRLIADGLTRAGVAVLRWDDRGVGKSTGDFDKAITSDFASDATAAINFLLTRDDIDHDKIGLLGHSEGGDVAAMLGASDKNLAFIVSMAGPAVNGADILLQQNKRILEAENSSADTIKAQLEFLPKLFEKIQAKDADGIRQLTHDTVLAQIKNLPADQLKEIGDPETYATKQADSAPTTYNTDWWRFFLTYDPGADWAKTTIPVLAIYGTLDVQVDADQNAPAFEAAMKKAGNTGYQLTILPKANHLMQAATTGSPTEYATLPQDFTPDFLLTIIDWLTKQGIIKPSA